MTSWTSGYPIGRPQRACSATGRVLNAGERTVATLIENLDTRQIERHDFAAEAWDAAKPPVPMERVIGVWRTTVPAADEKVKPILDDEAMLDLFAQTENARDGGARATLRLVLALLMVRRRLLTHDGNKGTTMLVRPRGTPRPPEGPALIEVHDPGLSESAINDVLMELEGLGMGDDAKPVTTGGAA